MPGVAARLGGLTASGTSERAAGRGDADPRPASRAPLPAFYALPDRRQSIWNWLCPINLDARTPRPSDHD